MGRTKNSGFGVGTGSSPQGSLFQGNVDAMVDKLTHEYMVKEYAVSTQNVELGDKLFGSIVNEEIKLDANKDDYNLPYAKFGHEDYYDKISKLSYKELVNSLLIKYGACKYDYFTGKDCSNKNQLVSRAKEGLFCHHIDEDKAIELSNPERARMNPFRYQKADRLVYCNFLEHLLLHIKIVEEPRHKDANPLEMPGIGGAVNLISRQINDFYGGYEYKRQDLINSTAIIKDDYKIYIKLLAKLYDAIQNNAYLLKRYGLKDLCKGWKGNLIDKIYTDLKLLINSK